MPYAADRDALHRIGIDRCRLLKDGLTENSINRLYRGLYVYSAGIHDLLEDTNMHNLEGGRISHVFWEVYISLLESMNTSSDNDSIIASGSLLFRSIHSVFFVFSTRC